MVTVPALETNVSIVSVLTWCIDDTLIINLTNDGLLQFGGSEPRLGQFPYFTDVHTTRTDCNGAPQGWFDIAQVPSGTSSFRLSLTTIGGNYAGAYEGCSCVFEYPYLLEQTPEGGGVIPCTTCQFPYPGAQQPYLNVVVDRVNLNGCQSINDVLATAGSDGGSSGGCSSSVPRLTVGNAVAVAVIAYVILGACCFLYYLVFKRRSLPMMQKMPCVGKGTSVMPTITTFGPFHGYPIESSTVKQVVTAQVTPQQPRTSHHQSYVPVANAVQTMANHIPSAPVQLI